MSSGSLRAPPRPSMTPAEDRDRDSCRAAAIGSKGLKWRQRRGAGLACAHSRGRRARFAVLECGVSDEARARGWGWRRHFADCTTPCVRKTVPPCARREARGAGHGSKNAVRAGAGARVMLESVFSSKWDVRSGHDRGSAEPPGSLGLLGARAPTYSTTYRCDRFDGVPACDPASRTSASLRSN